MFVVLIFDVCIASVLQNDSSFTPDEFPSASKVYSLELGMFSPQYDTSSDIFSLDGIIICLLREMSFSNTYLIAL